MIRIAVDAMGGDRGPDEIVAGAVAAASDAVQPIVVGRSGLDTQGLEFLHAPDVITMEDKPTEAIRAKPASSLVVACKAVAEGKADAVVSPGNTGAMLAACLRELRRIGQRAKNSFRFCCNVSDDVDCSLVSVGCGANTRAR